MDALRHEVTVACDQQAAFDLFTRGMGTWWDPAHTPDPDTFSGIDLDPRVGGRILLCQGAEASEVGAVVVWEPPKRYAQTFWMGMDAAHPTRIDVAFVGVDGVCTVRLDHGGWVEENVEARSRYSDWPHLLGRFAEAAARLG